MLGAGSISTKGAISIEFLMENDIYIKCKWIFFFFFFKKKLKLCDGIVRAG